MGAAMASAIFSRIALAGLVVAVLVLQAAAQEAPKPEPKQNIVVSIEDRKLALLEDGVVKKVYPVAVGKPSTPSPVGTFTIERRVKNPTYSHNGKVIPPGPANPVGTRWMGLSIRGYGIHGTNEPRSIGKAASHGCIRLAQADLEDLYAQVHVGDTVELIGQRNEETAALFGGAPASILPAASPALIAKALPASSAVEPVAPAVLATTIDGSETREGSQR